LLEAARGMPHVADVRRCGLIGAIDLVDANSKAFPPHWRIGGAVCMAMRKYGVMLRPLADTIVVMPPLAIAEEHLKVLCDAVVAAIGEVPLIVEQ
jgi:adenosylmethionine-8-amino-7-oxononanoate aminotransferase